MNENILLVSGTMRSGTTLMSVMLNAHPEIALITDKINWFWNRIYPQYKIDSIMSLEQAFFEQEHYLRLGLKHFDIGIEEFKKRVLKELKNNKINEINTYKAIHKTILPVNSSLKGDKSTQSALIYYRFIKQFNGKVIHVIRNPFDVYYSQLTKVNKPHKRKKNYLMSLTANLYHQLRYNKDKLLLNSLSNKEKLKHNTGSLVMRNYFRENPISIVDSWIRASKIAIKLEKDYPNNIMIVRYEDLIQNQENTLQAIMQFLDLSYHKDYFDFKNLKDEKGNKFVSNSSFKKDINKYDKTRIGNGKNNISNVDFEYIKHNTKELLEQFKY
jgi:hypothetical protein